MADLDVQHKSQAPKEGYTVLELIFWVGGILLIPLVPILMIYFLTPHSGM